MRNLKKRILSFVSAVAMVATLLPTTALFASADDPVVVDTGLTWETAAVNDSSEWSSSTRVTKTFNVETAGTYDLAAIWQGTQSADIQSKIKVNGTDVTEVLHHSGDYWSNNTVNATGIHLNAGENTIAFEGMYFKYYDAKFTLTEADVVETEFAVTFSATAGGSVTATVDGTPISSGDMVDKGKEVVFTAAADEDYAFTKWSDNETTNPYTVTVNNAINLRANFALDSENAITVSDTIQVASKVYYDGDWSSTTYNFDVPDGASNFKLYVEYEGNGGATFKTSVNGTALTGTFAQGTWVGDVTGGSNYWVANGDGDEPLKKSGSIDLNAGATNTVKVEGQSYAHFDKVYITYDITMLKFAEQPTVKVNNEAYGSLTKTVSSDTDFYIGETIKPVAKDGYMFVNWTIVDGDNVVPIHNVFPAIKDTKKNITLTAEMAGKTIYANFGKKTAVRFEAENFADFVSETKYQDSTIQNRHAYDDPTPVSQGNSSTGVFGEKTQQWDDVSYSNHKIAPEYSAGGAVALTGPSNGMAIPFTIDEDLADDLEIEMGYNYGDLKEVYENSGSSWPTGGLFVNLYYSGDNYEKFANLCAGATPSLGKSALATPEAASDLLKSQGTLAGNAYNVKLPKGDARDQLQVTTIVLPAGMPAGNYFISVATDQNNCTEWESYDYNNKYHNLDYESNVIKDHAQYASEDNAAGNVGTAFYDYIQFYTASTPDKPSPLTVGANFVFTDMWGNDLLSNAMSKSTYNKTTGIKFSPSAPRYLVAQGYNIVGWTISQSVDGVYQPLSGYTFTYNDKEYTTDSNGYVEIRSDGKTSEYDKTTEKSNIDNTTFAINAAEFAAGSTVKFEAKYEVAVAPKTITVTDAKLYVKSFDTDDDYGSLAVDATNGTGDPYSVPNFGEVRLEPSLPAGDFGYWLLNGFIYSYEADIHFAAWTDADFTAHVADSSTATGVAFIDKTARTSGFEVEDPNYHKISYNCAYYVPDGATYVSAGIVYSNDETAVKNATVNVDSETGELTVTSNTAGKNVIYTTVKSNLLLGGSDSNKYNRQVMVSISNMKTGVNRSARAYLIYKVGGEYRLAVSSNTTSVAATVSGLPE